MKLTLSFFLKRILNARDLTSFTQAAFDCEQFALDRLGQATKLAIENSTKVGVLNKMAPFCLLARSI